jgi:hypothetical protein
MLIALIVATLMIGVPAVWLSLVGMGARYDPRTGGASRRHGHISTARPSCREYRP